VVEGVPSRVGDGVVNVVGLLGAITFEYVLVIIMPEPPLAGN
jgi:hypothetical protein